MSSFEKACSFIIDEDLTEKTILLKDIYNNPTKYPHIDLNNFNILEFVFRDYQEFVDKFKITEG